MHSIGVAANVGTVNYFGFGFVVGRVFARTVRAWSLPDPHPQKPSKFQAGDDGHAHGLADGPNN